MKYEVGNLVIGKVKNIKPYALFMEFEDSVQGLLHISEISDSFIRDIEEYGSIGDEIKVKILTIDPSNGFLRVSLKQVDEQERFSTHEKNKRSIPKIKEEEFSPLKEKLPEWITSTLERKNK